MRSAAFPTAWLRAAVVLRLRGKTTLGATFFDVISDYAEQLDDAGGTVVLTGLSEPLAEQLHSVGKVDVEGHVGTYMASDIVGESTMAGYQAALSWTIAYHRPDSSDNGGST